MGLFVWLLSVSVGKFAPIVLLKQKVKTFMENQNEKALVILALSSGEHILTEAVEVEHSYVCSNALQILSEMDRASGQISFGVIPYLPFADAEAGIAIPTNMAIIAIPSEDLRRMYSERFSSVYTPPEQKIFLG